MRDAARRQAELAELADGAEIGGAEEGDPGSLGFQSPLPVRLSWIQKPAKADGSGGSLAAGLSGRTVK